MFPAKPTCSFLAVLLFPLFFGASAHTETFGASAQTETQVPRSEISRAAYQRLAPQLEQEMRDKNLQLGQPIFIRIFKEENELEVWVKKDLAYDLFKTYRICKYSGKLGPKLKEGDEQSPEGFYTVSVTALNPWSDFHLSFNLGYPNEFDRLHKRTGGALMVHGKCASVGCFAMDDFRIEEIYTLVDAALSSGQEQFSVHIFPFRMTWDKMAQNAKSPWISFWENLKQGYDFFQGYRTPPLVTVQEQKYAFQTILPLLFGGELTPAQSLPRPDVEKVAEIRIKPLKEKRYAAVGKKSSKNRSAL